jgi:hypothetical protein
MNPPECPDVPIILGNGRSLDKNASDPALGHRKLLHLNVRSIYQKSLELHAHELVPLQRKPSIGRVSVTSPTTIINQCKTKIIGMGKQNMTTIKQTDFLDKLFYIFGGRES